jgi:plastocyanin domain-containing protein
MKLAAILVGTIISIFPMGESEMPHSPTNKSFRQIEQPLPIKIGVVLGGLTLAGAELWWFLGRKQQQQQATQSNGAQEVLVSMVAIAQIELSLL